MHISIWIISILFFFFCVGGGGGTLEDGPAAKNLPTPKGVDLQGKVVA